MPTSIDVRDFVRSLAQLEASIEAAAQTILKDVASFAADAARTAPHFRDRTSALRSSIRRHVRGTWHQSVSAGTFGPSGAYAQFVEAGTGPHIIRAKGKANGGADFLRFVQDGVVRYAKQVQHPGTPGNRPTHYRRHFLADSQHEAAEMVPRFAEANLSRLFR